MNFSGTAFSSLSLTNYHYIKNQAGFAGQVSQKPRDTWVNLAPGNQGLSLAGTG